MMFCYSFEVPFKKLETLYENISISNYELKTEKKTNEIKFKIKTDIELDDLTVCK